MHNNNNNNTKTLIQMEEEQIAKAISSILVGKKNAETAVQKNELSRSRIQSHQNSTCIQNTAKFNIGNLIVITIKSYLSEKFVSYVEELKFLYKNEQKNTLAQNFLCSVAQILDFIFIWLVIFRVCTVAGAATTCCHLPLLP